MNDNETTADVIAAMRDEAARADMEQEYSIDDAAEMMREFAWRFEAAHKREKAAIEADALAVGGMVAAAAEKPSAVGDVAKLREALEFCVKGMCGFCRMDAEARGMTTRCVRGCEALLMAKAALAAPPRNCDVGTAEEQSVRMAEFCRAQYKKTDGVRLCSGCRFFELAGAECPFAWAQLPYEEGGAK